MTKGKRSMVQLKLSICYLVQCWENENLATTILCQSSHILQTTLMLTIDIFNWNHQVVEKEYNCFCSLYLVTDISFYILDGLDPSLFCLYLLSLSFTCSVLLSGWQIFWGATYRGDIVWGGIWDINTINASICKWHRNIITLNRYFGSSIAEWDMMCVGR